MNNGYDALFTNYSLLHSLDIVWHDIQLDVWLRLFP